MSETFGQRLRRLRTEQGLSRAELAVTARLVQYSLLVMQKKTAQMHCSSYHHTITRLRKRV